MATAHMLTTIDNPFDPFTQYDEWLSWDEDQGYYSNSLLARIAITSDELSDSDQEKAIELAIDEIVAMNAIGVYKKASKEP